MTKRRFGDGTLISKSTSSSSAAAAAAAAGAIEAEAYPKTKRPRFPVASQLGEIFDEVEDGMIVRNNVEFLTSMAKLSLFTRPTQMGKSTLFSLAEKVYSKTETAPDVAAAIVLENERNAGFVLRFDFLQVSAVTMAELTWTENLKQIDLNLLEYVKECVHELLRYDAPELRQHFIEPDANATAGKYLRSLVNAVARYSKTNQTDEFLMVLVDEYDRPVRETLFRLLLSLETDVKASMVPNCPNYVDFFSACKVVGGKLPGNRVWVTGVVPIVLDIISDFNPENLTFQSEMSDALGLREEDVNRMLNCVHSAEPFNSEEEKELVREAIRDHANHLQFLGGSSLYHTRMVNELMRLLLRPKEREMWLATLSKLPGSVTRERAPSAIFELLKQSAVCRKVAKELVARRDIHGTLNERLNLPDVARADIVKDDYLTLLVHLGIASVHESEAGNGVVFRSTSRYFRSQYLNELLGVTLAPLFELSTVDQIYSRRDLLQEFLATLPVSAMSKMIAWAKASRGNRILELQFQGYLVGELHDHFLADFDAAVHTTQEDVLESGSRTDIQIRGKNTMLILELKQKPSVAAPPTKAEMSLYHAQLHGYMEEVSSKMSGTIVAGFVVVMYANGTKFHIERTTYETK